MAGSVLPHVARSNGLSRAALMEAAGLSRVTLAQRLYALLDAGIVREGSRTVPSGGRPTRLLTLNPSAAVMLTADMGETHIRLAVTDLSPTILAQETISFRISAGPLAALERIAEGFDRLLRPAESFVLGTGISLPAPVDHRAGRVVGPSILVGWDNFPIGAWLAARFEAPAIVENDVNLMTVYEYRRPDVTAKELFFVKIGTGIGSGIVTDGRLHRGAQGASGDIGHIQFLGQEAPLCRCGKLGCLEARAGGWALARDLRALGFDATDARDVIALVDRQVPEAIQRVEAAGRAVGEAICAAISILNPGQIVIGGTLARAGAPLLAGIREMIYRRCLPLATRDLVLLASPPVDEACLLGAAHSVLEHVFSPSETPRFLARYGAWLGAARRCA